MKTTIEINGKSVEIELTTEQVAKIKKAGEKITDRIKTFSDVLSALNIDPRDFKEICKNLEEDEIAYRQVKLIARVLNEGTEIDAFNQSQYKYYPYFEVEKSGFSYRYYGTWFSITSVGSRLCFKSSELAIYAGKTFIDIYTKLLK